MMLNASDLCDRYNKMVYEVTDESCHIYGTHSYRGTREFLYRCASVSYNIEHIYSGIEFRKQSIVIPAIVSGSLVLHNPTNFIRLQERCESACYLSILIEYMQFTLSFPEIMPSFNGGSISFTCRNIVYTSDTK